jgi:NADH:ubiquinone oxidoreductase subunit C
MFGIFFFDHYNLTRLLTDYGFLGMPLKKDFPLSGYFELFFLDSTSSINYIPIEMSQEFRVFKFLSPWEQV